MMAATLGVVLPIWTVWQEAARSGVDTLMTSILQQAGENENDIRAEYLPALEWLKAHIMEVEFGLMVWPVLASACIAVEVASRWVRKRFAIAGLRGSFRTMRVSEWLVWAVIATAAAWFIERQWPSGTLRVVSWNAAFGLAAVYWMNGLSVGAYVVSVLHPPALLLAAMIFLLVMSGAHSMLCFVGLFDTWWDFRRGADRLAEKQRRIMETLTGNDGEPPTRHEEAVGNPSSPNNSPLDEDRRQEEDNSPGNGVSQDDDNNKDG